MQTSPNILLHNILSHYKNRHYYRELKEFNSCVLNLNLENYTSALLKEHLSSKAKIHEDMFSIFR